MRTFAPLVFGLSQIKPELGRNQGVKRLFPFCLGITYLKKWNSFLTVYVILKISLQLFVVNLL